MRIFSILIMALTINMGTIQASEYECTTWEKNRGVSCIFAGRSAQVWSRRCENACWYNPRTRRGNWGPECDRTRFCHPTVNPNEMLSECTDWVQEKGVICHNPISDDWEDKWVRRCLNGRREQICRDDNPNL